MHWELVDLHFLNQSELAARLVMIVLTSKLLLHNFKLLVVLLYLLFLLPHQVHLLLMNEFISSRDLYKFIQLLIVVTLKYRDHWLVLAFDYFYVKHHFEGVSGGATLLADRRHYTIVVHATEIPTFS